MAKISITNDELVQFRTAAQAYINRYPDRTKLHYALERTLKKTLTLFEDYADKENDYRVDAAIIDEKTKTFTYLEDVVGGQTRRQLAVDPAKAKTLQANMRKLGREKVEIETYFTTEQPKDLEAMWHQVFSGIVIPEEREDSAKDALTESEALSK
ncbi:MAG TPA: hypothetical protein VL443_24370 [Cyclobacteriaceae bacterium]|jgi:hypothetical protein|nr:hypothetical protein [Cyclobacteriaceae bacterium]